MAVHQLIVVSWRNGLYLVCKKYLIGELLIYCEKYISGSDLMGDLCQLRYFWRDFCSSTTGLKADRCSLVTRPFTSLRPVQVILGTSPHAECFSKPPIRSGTVCSI